MYEQFRCVMWNDGEVYCCYCSKLDLSGVGETEGDAKYDLVKQIGLAVEGILVERTRKFVDDIPDVNTPFYVSKMNVIAIDEDRLLLRVYDNDYTLSSFGFWPFVYACRNFFVSKYDRVAKFVDRVKE